MSRYSLPSQINQHCHVIKVYTAGWHHSLPLTIRDASRELADLVSHEYRCTPLLHEYRVFSAEGTDCWIIGVSAGPSDVPDGNLGGIYTSTRLIERWHCTDNIALIIEHELNKMPVRGITSINLQK